MFSTCRCGGERWSTDCCILPVTSFWWLYLHVVMIWVKDKQSWTAAVTAWRRCWSWAVSEHVSLWFDLKNRKCVWLLTAAVSASLHNTHTTFPLRQRCSNNTKNSCRHTHTLLKNTLLFKAEFLSNNDLSLLCLLWFPTYNLLKHVFLSAVQTIWSQHLCFFPPIVYSDYFI